MAEHAVDTRHVGKVRRIAAIDFGTTFCSLAYTLSERDQIGNMGLNWVRERVPTAILLKKMPDDTFTVNKFGYQAQEELADLGGKLKDYLYFECFKMQLRGDVVSSSARMQLRLVIMNLRRQLSCTYCVAMELTYLF